MIDPSASPIAHSCWPCKILDPQWTHYMVDIQVSWLSTVSGNSLQEDEGVGADHHPSSARHFLCIIHFIRKAALS